MIELKNLYFIFFKNKKIKVKAWKIITMTNASIIPPQYLFKEDKYLKLFCSLLLRYIISLCCLLREYLVLIMEDVPV